MKSNMGLNVITSGGIFLSTVFLVIMGVLLMTASNKIKNLPDFNQSSSLQNNYHNLRIAYIIIFIVAGINLLLSVLYAGHEAWWTPSEWIHSGIFLISIVLLLVSAIYAYSVLDSIYTPALDDRNGADGYIWASLLFAVLSFIVLLTMASGRISYNIVKDDITDRYNDLEHKVHLTHSHLSGVPVDYDKIGAEPTNQMAFNMAREEPQRMSISPALSLNQSPPASPMYMAGQGGPAPPFSSSR